MNEKAIEELSSAPAQKRYDHFVNAEADNDRVWLLGDGEGFISYEHEGFTHYLVWPQEVFAQRFADVRQPDDTPVSMDAHRFMDNLKGMAGASIHFMVFAVEGADAVVVSAEQLLADLTDAMERVE